MTSRTTAGFTVVEVLVAIAIAGLLSTVLVSTVSTQNRRQSQQDDAQLIEQTTRVIADGLVPEIRAAGPRDIIQAAPDRFVVRTDIARALVCATLPGGVVDLFVYDSIPGVNVPRAFRGTAVSGPYDTPFTYADGFQPTASPSPAAAATCRANGSDSAGVAPSSAFQRTQGWSAGFASAPIHGSIVRTYGSLSYSVVPSTTLPGNLAIRRNLQEFATPLAPGAAFEYVLANGTVVPSVGPGNLANVRVVRLITTAVGRTPGTSGRSVVHEMPLRN